MPARRCSSFVERFRPISKRELPFTFSINPLHDLWNPNRFDVYGHLLWLAIKNRPQYINVFRTRRTHRFQISGFKRGLRNYVINVSRHLDIKHTIHDVAKLSSVLASTHLRIHFKLLSTNKNSTGRYFSALVIFLF